MCAIIFPGAICFNPNFSTFQTSVCCFGTFFIANTLGSDQSGLAVVPKGCREDAGWGQFVVNTAMFVTGSVTKEPSA